MVVSGLVGRWVAVLRYATSFFGFLIRRCCNVPLLCKKGTHTLGLVRRITRTVYGMDPAEIDVRWVHPFPTASAYEGMIRARVYSKGQTFSSLSRLFHKKKAPEWDRHNCGGNTHRPSLIRPSLIRSLLIGSMLALDTFGSTYRLTCMYLYKMFFATAG